MNILKACHGLLSSAQGRNVVRKYNKVALVLTEYELVLYQAWVSNMETANKSLHVSSPVQLATPCAL